MLVIGLPDLAVALGALPASWQINNSSIGALTRWATWLPLDVSNSMCQTSHGKPEVFSSISHTAFTVHRTQHTLVSISQPHAWYNQFLHSLRLFHNTKLITGTACHGNFAVSATETSKLTTLVVKVYSTDGRGMGMSLARQAPKKSADKPQQSSQSSTCDSELKKRCWHSMGLNLHNIGKHLLYWHTVLYYGPDMRLCGCEFDLLKLNPEACWLVNLAKKTNQTDKHANMMKPCGSILFTCPYRPGHEGHLLLGNATNCHAEDALHGVICRP